MPAHVHEATISKKAHANRAAEARTHLHRRGHMQQVLQVRKFAEHTAAVLPAHMHEATIRKKAHANRAASPHPPASLLTLLSAPPLSPPSLSIQYAPQQRVSVKARQKKQSSKPTPTCIVVDAPEGKTPAKRRMARRDRHLPASLCCRSGSQAQRSSVRVLLKTARPLAPSGPALYY